jgi:O-antigen/teichoic acid export membrane protein
LRRVLLFGLFAAAIVWLVRALRSQRAAVPAVGDATSSAPLAATVVAVEHEIPDASEPVEAPANDEAEGEKRESVLSGSALGMAAQAISALFTAGLTLYLARALGAHGYGVFGVALGLAASILVPADLGISMATARRVAGANADAKLWSKVLAGGLRLKCLFTGAVSVALFALAPQIASAYSIPGLVWPLRAAAVAMFGQGMLIFYSASFVAMGRVRFQLQTFAIESFVETSASVALVAAGFGVAGAVWGRAIGYLIGCACAALIMARVARRAGTRIRLRGARAHPRLAGEAAALLMVDGAFTMFTQIDVLLLSAFIGAAASGVFQAPMRLTIVLGYPGIAVAQALGPRVARGARERNRAPFTSAMRWLLVIGVAEAVFVIVWAGPIAHVALGAGYARSAGVLRGFAPYLLLSSLAPLVSAVVNFAGEAKRRVPFAIATLGLNALVDVILIPRLGPLAGAIGTDVAFLLYVPGHIWLCRNLISVRIRDLVRTTARSVVAGGAMAAAMIPLLTFGSSGVVGLVAGSAAGAVAFAIALLALGEVSVPALGRGDRNSSTRPGRERWLPVLRSS